MSKGFCFNPMCAYFLFLLQQEPKVRGITALNFSDSAKLVRMGENA